MAVITLAADSTTLTLNGRVFNDLVAGDYLVLTPANPHSSHVNSQDGGVSINRRVDGDVYDLTIRVQKFSADDVYMNSVINGNGGGITLLNGSAKENFNRDGTDGVETWTLANGSVTTMPTGTRNDQDGNALSEYVVRFRSAVRSL